MPQLMKYLQRLRPTDFGGKMVIRSTIQFGMLEKNMIFR